MVKRQLSLSRHPSTAPRLPEFLRRSGPWNRVVDFCSAHLNFYRIHLLIFTFTPLITSAIFYASNGENHVAYVDALFMCTSGMGVVGLNTVALSTVTTWQQFIIFALMSIGSTSFVSIIVIGIRRRFFRKKFEYMVKHDEEARKRVNLIGAEEAARAGRSYKAFDADHPPVHAPWIANLLGGGKMPNPSAPVTPRPSPAGSQVPSIDDDRAGGGGGGAKRRKKKFGRLRADMIKRVDVPVRINEMSVSGWLKERRAATHDGDGDGKGEGSQHEMSDFPVTRPGSRPGAAAALRRDDDASSSSDVSVNEEGEEETPEGSGTDREDEEDDDDEDAGVDSRDPSRPSSPPAIVFSEPAQHPRRSMDSADEPAATARGRSYTLQSRDGSRGLGTPEREVSPPPGGRQDPTGHLRAIQIDEPERPPHNRFRRNSDSAASPSRINTNLAFSRTRTADHAHMQQIVESPSSMQSPAVSPVYPRRSDLDFGRNRTIEFRDPSQQDLRLRRNRTIVPPTDPDHPAAQRRPSQSNLQGHRDVGPRTLTRTTTVDQTAMHTGFGGFPNPLVAAAAYAKQHIPVLRNAVERNLTMQRSTTMVSTHSHTSHNESMTGGVRHGTTGHVKPVSYITFDAVVGRNSRFHGLTTAQQEELGGVEYRALSVLFKIVLGYWIGIQLIGVLLLAPYLNAVQEWRTIITDYDISPTWFTFFQFWSAYSNLGMSLVDASMVPFQKCYFLVITMFILILGGNTAFPVFLRLLIWLISKVVPRNSQLRETLQFLLDHPRRCFIYLFPSHQTWLLVFMLILLNGIDWASFCILDIGTSVIEVLPVGTRIIDGLFQASAVRAAGFSIVSISQTAPALQLLYVIMMYIAVYPIAVSIRSTNVYEEKSMGVYDENYEDDDDDAEAQFNKTHSATAYIGYHARKQLAFDMWWLVLGIWLICIVERSRIGSAEWPEVTIFSLIFEVVSAYGTVGLSLGNTRDDTALSGVLSTLSKLIIIAVMIRGRHRGLPIAIDRAVLLPSDLEKHGDDTATRTSSENNELRVRPTRTSFSSMTAVTPGNQGDVGLNSINALPDDDRMSRSRRNSYGAKSSDFSHHDANVDQGGETVVRGYDHHLGPSPHVLQESDTSDDKDPGLASSSSGAATTSLESEKQVDDHLPDGQPVDRKDQPGWT